MKQNLHTHSIYCDGNDEIEEMVLEAINRGFDTLGFSGHGNNRPYDPISMDDAKEEKYKEAIYQANEQYGDRIHILLGIEEDSIGKRFSHDDYEYIIGSVHFLEKDGEFAPIDYSEARFQQILNDWYDGDILAMAKDYYEAVKEMASREEVDMIGHLDLISKYNENNKYFDFEDPAYIALAEDAIDHIIANGKIIEINTGAMARGYRTTPYPHIWLLKYIHDNGGQIMITSDCHNRFNLDLGFDTALSLAKSAGFNEIAAVVDDEFQLVPIEEFEK